jgi:hypothetical protein
VFVAVLDQFVLIISTFISTICKETETWNTMCLLLLNFNENCWLFR